MTEKALKIKVPILAAVLLLPGEGGVEHAG